MDGFRPSARRGQNFLFDVQLLDAFLDDAGVEPGDRILEIGAGAGTLTRRLLERGAEVLAVEVDRCLVRFLERTLSSPRLRLLPIDALAGKNRLAEELVSALREWPGPYRLVANLPYAITVPVIQLLLEEQPPLASMGVLLQRELAERLVAEPGSKRYGPISVLLALSGQGRIRRLVPRAVFTPRPQVESAFYTWRRFGRPTPDLAPVRRLSRMLFQHRRKMLRTLLGDQIPPGDPWWAAPGRDPRRRPEEVAPEEYVELTEELARRKRADFE